MRRLLALLLLLAGCTTPREQATFDASHSEKALVRWRNGSSSLIGDAVFMRSRTGEVLVRLYKQSPTALFELRLRKDGVLAARGVMVGRSWTGRAQDAPAAMAAWVELLRIYQRTPDLPAGAHEIHAASSRTAYVKESDRLRSLGVLNTDTGASVNAAF